MGTGKRVKKAKSRKRVLGWREWVHLPDLKLPRIKAKVDTGARTSVLHAENIAYFRRSGRRMVRFRVYPHQSDRSGSVTREARVKEIRAIRSSIGHVTQRPVISTKLEIGHQVWKVELTLVDREIMGFRMLLGRQAIRRRFLVDPSLSYLGGKPKRSQT